MMGAIAMWLQAQARRRWRAWLGLAVIIGLGAGATTAAAMGARRASTAFPRLVDYTGEFDISTGGLNGDESEWLPSLEKLAELPQVAVAVRAYTPTAWLGPGPGILTSTGRPVPFTSLVPIAVAPQDAAKIAHGAKLLRGRQPRRPDEATVSFAAEGPGLRIGDTVRLRLSADYEHETQIPVKIVGVHASPGEFPSASGGSFPALDLSPAFVDAHRSLIADDSSELGMAFRLKRGAADVAAFRAEAVRRRIPVAFPSASAAHSAGVRKTTRFEAASLWLLAALLGVAAAAILGQALSRQASVDADDHRTIAALGVTRRQLIAVGAIRSAAIGVAAAAVAILVAVLASPLTPIGLSRIAEPDPGIVVDAFALLVGGLVTVVAVIAISLPAVWRSARRPALGQQSATRPSRLAGALASAGASPAATSGVQMAVEPGRGAAAVPVRSAELGIALGIAALAASFVFAASLNHLVRTPSLSGYTWDAQLTGSGGLAAALRSDPRVRDVHKGGAIAITIGGERMLALAYDEAGPARPAIVEGAVPLGRDEIALGGATMRRMGVRIGSTVRVVRALTEGEDPTTPTPALRLRVVGRTVVPPLFFEAQQPGLSAAMSGNAAARLYEPQRDPFMVGGDSFWYFVRFAPGVTLDDVLTGPHARAITNNLAFIVPRQTPGDLRTVAGVSTLPVALGAVVAALAAGTLVHALVSTVRRRRRDLAMLKTLGFVRAQTMATVAWQTTVMTTIGLIVGLPAGTVIGRWLWHAFADELAVVPVRVVPISAVLAILPATVLLANAIAALPARAAARTRPALALRTE